MYLHFNQAYFQTAKLNKFFFYTFFTSLILSVDLSTWIQMNFWTQVPKSSDGLFGRKFYPLLKKNCGIFPNFQVKEKKTSLEVDPTFW